MTEITLIRHGKPKFELEGKARSREVKEIIKSYDLSGISEEPPTVAKEKALTCKVAVCSDICVVQLNPQRHLDSQTLIKLIVYLEKWPCLILRVAH